MTKDEKIKELEEEIRQLKALLVPTQFLSIVDGTPGERALLAALLRVAPQRISYEKLYETITAYYSRRGDVEIPRNILQQFKCRLKPRLAKMGTKIQTEFGFGFWISREDAERLKASATG